MQIDSLTTTSDSLKTNSDFIEEYSPSISFTADIITVVMLFVTVWTLVTVKRYKSKVIDKRIIEQNLSSLKKTYNRLTRYRTSSGNPLPDNTFSALLLYVKQLQNYSSILGKRKYKKHVKSILEIENLSDDNIDRIINELETIIGILEND